jgi:hypothetical protein
LQEYRQIKEIWARTVAQIFDTANLPTSTLLPNRVVCLTNGGSNTMENNTPSQAPQPTPSQPITIQQPPKRKPPFVITGTMVLIAAGVALILCVVVVIAAILALRTPGTPTVSTSPQMPPNYGVFLTNNGRLVELPTKMGQAPSTTVIAQEAQPKITVWLQDVNLDLLILALESSRDTRIPYKTTPGTNGVLTLVPSQPLTSGIYCLQQGNPMMPPNMIPYWCFRGPGTTAVRATSSPAMAVSPTPVWPPTGLQAYCHGPRSLVAIWTNAAKLPGGVPHRFSHPFATI